MDVETFWNITEDIAETSGNLDTRSKVRSVVEDYNEWKPALSIYAGQRLDDLGVDKITVRKGIAESKLPFTKDDVKELQKEYNSTTEALMSNYDIGSQPTQLSTGTQSLTNWTEDSSDETTTVYGEAQLSSAYNDIEELHQYSGNRLIQELADLFESYYPPLVSYAVLDDYSIGVKDSTVSRSIAEKSYDDLDEIHRLQGLIPDAVEFVERYLEDDLITEPQLHKPLKPMLARSINDEKDETSLDNHIAQYKLDGNRLVLHIGEDDITAHTRSFTEYSDRINELKEIDWPSEPVILDCEAVAYNPETEERLPFSKSGAMRRKEGSEEVDYEIRFYGFDVLHFDGEDMTKKTFRERDNVLDEIGEEISSHLFTTVDTFTDISAAKHRAEEDDLEGIMVKDTNSEYKFKRTRDWEKVKLRMKTADLVLADFEEGDGRRSGSLGRAALETADGEFVGYVGTGFDDDLADKIWKNQQNYRGKVVEIQFDGYDDALRTPSFIRFRPEGEADTLDRLEKISPEM